MIKFGIVANTHGLNGHVKILSNSDFKEKRLKKGAKLVLKDQLKTVEVEVVVQTWKSQNGAEIVKLEGYDNIPQAQTIKGFNIFVEELTSDDIGEDEFLYEDLKKSQVLDQEGNLLGKVTNVVNFGADDLLEIRTVETRLIKLVPFNEVFVLDVDVKNKKIVINAMDGLLNEI